MMAKIKSVSVLLGVIAALAVTIEAQQLDGYTFPHELLGLSDGCFAAVNSTVPSCPAWLARYVGRQQASVEILTSDLLIALCESSCQDDLTTLQSSIKSACTESTDVMVPNNIAYPATYLVDRFLYASSLSCLQDESTGEYCDILVADWANQTNYTDAQTCSYCELGLQQIQLSSPFGYSDEYAEIFANTTASCSQGSYNYETPTSYALNATTASSLPTCSGSTYTVQENDTCVTISNVTNVSTFQLIQQNLLNIACNDLPDVGQSLCLPQTCEIYQLDMLDTCDSLITTWNITLAQLRGWNPMINAACSNLASWRGWYLCISSPSGTVSVSAGDSVTTAAPAPTDAQPQSNIDCAEWYYVQAGDYCAAISVKFGISLSDFYFLNPQVDTSCSNLWANTSYCVEAVGNIQTYSGYTTTTAATTYTKTARSTGYTATPVESISLKATASGTVSDCYLYENAWDSTSGLSDLDEKNSCVNWADFADVTVDYLLAWNPSLSADDCVFQSDYSYCVRLWEYAPNITYPYDYCIAPNSTRIPTTSAQPDTCECYTQFRSLDKNNFNCSMIPSLLNMAVATLASLNLWIDVDNCDATIWSQLTDDGYEQICVLANSTSSGVSTSLVASPTASMTATMTSVTASAPTEPGIAADCTEFHTVVSGDTCYDIAVTYGLTLDEFYALNSGVGTDCSSLWLGYAVCVGN